jgi:hypothetical protein
MNRDLHAIGLKKSGHGKHQPQRVAERSLTGGKLGILESARADFNPTALVRRDAHGGTQIQGDIHRAGLQMLQYVGKRPHVEGPAHVDPTRCRRRHRADFQKSSPVQVRLALSLGHGRFPLS